MLKKISYKQVTFNKATKTLTVEASDIELRNTPRYIEIEGKSKTVTFTYHHKDVDPEGEIFAHVYHDPDETMSLLVFND
jgi:hypothetical protein